jgi:hypothetical protein
MVPSSILISLASSLGCTKNLLVTDAMKLDELCTIICIYGCLVLEEANNFNPSCDFCLYLPVPEKCTA